MCGICGQISFCENLNDFTEYFYNMQNRLIHRGPDQHGEFFSSEAVLMHRRLAVIDIERGKQPMTYAVGNETFTVCYNGELFNLPFNMHTFYQMWGVITPAEAKAKIEEYNQLVHKILLLFVQDPNY